MRIKFALIILSIIIILKHFNNFSFIELAIILFSFSALILIIIKDIKEDINHYKLQLSIHKLLLEARNKKDLFEGICKNIVSYGNFSTCWVGFVNDQGIIKPEFSYGFGIKFLYTININIKNGLGSEYLNGEVPSPKFHQSILKFNWKDFYYHPITIGDRVIGLFAVYSNNISNNDRKLLNKIIFSLNEYIKKHESSRIYKRIFEKNINAIVITDESNNIIKVNSKFTDITGYSANDVIGKNPKMLSAKKHDKMFYNQMWGSINLNGFWNGEVINKRKNGEEYHQYLSITNIYNEDNQIVNRVAIFYDLSTIKEKEEAIEFLLFHDPKTLLHNSKYLNVQYGNIIKTNDTVAFCIIKINKFKITLGYELQTDLIKQIALRLKSNIKKEDIIIYLDSGDFLVITTVKNISSINILCERLINTSIVPYSLNNDLLVNININIGIVLYKINGDILEDILEKAEIAVNKSKTLGPNTFAFYDRKMQTNSENRIIMATELKNAIESKSVGILYDPIIDLSNNKLFAVEAELYWDSPSLGRLHQTDFIQIVEELGLIIDFETFLFNEIFHDIITFKQFIPNIKIHVNLSSKSKQFISYILNDFSTPPDFICLAFNDLEDIENQTSLINEIRTLGMNLIINNFGASQNNLLTLQQLPISKIRISDQFVKDIDNSNDNMIICESIINLAHNLKIKTIAEGVSTKSEFEVLKTIYCDFVQGEYISQPLEKKELLEFFNNFI